MAKSNTKKKSEFSDKMTKSVFFHGNPNKEKAALFAAGQKQFTENANDFIRELNAREECIPFLVLGDNRSSEMRALEKELRKKGDSATFSQAEFDEAFVKLSNRMDEIRREVCGIVNNPFTISKVLYGLTLINADKGTMITRINEIICSYKDPDKVPKRFHEWKQYLEDMDDDTFQDLTNEVRFFHESTSLCHKIPEIKKAHVRLVSTNEYLVTDPKDPQFCIEEANEIKADAVIGISLPGIRGYTVVPLKTSRNSMRRLRQYEM